MQDTIFITRTVTGVVALVLKSFFKRPDEVTVPSQEVACLMDPKCLVYMRADEILSDTHISFRCQTQHLQPKGAGNVENVQEVTYIVSGACTRDQFTALRR